jgi:hypothetical protein
MFASNQTGALLASVSRVLAPASSPAHSVSSWHYATESWTPQGTLLGAVLLVLALLVVGAVVRGARS